MLSKVRPNFDIPCYGLEYLFERMNYDIFKEGAGIQLNRRCSVTVVAEARDKRISGEEVIGATIGTLL